MLSQDLSQVIISRAYCVVWVTALLEEQNPNNLIRVKLRLLCCSSSINARGTKNLQVRANVKVQLAVDNLTTSLFFLSL